MEHYQKEIEAKSQIYRKTLDMNTSGIGNVDIEFQVTMSHKVSTLYLLLKQILEIVIMTNNISFNIFTLVNNFGTEKNA